MLTSTVSRNWQIEGSPVYVCVCVCVYVGARAESLDERYQPSGKVTTKMKLRRQHYDKSKTVCAREFKFSRLVNLLPWNDVPRTTREFFLPKLQRFLSFKYI